MTYNNNKPCYCSIGAGGNPCIDRDYCDANRQQMWDKEQQKRTQHEGTADTSECNTLPRSVR